MKKVAVIIGSDTDLPVIDKVFKKLKDFDIPFEAHIMSAHRTPSIVMDFAANARKNGFGVVIAAAGMAAHLAGVVAANTTLPVIAVPIKSSLDGIDALLAMVQMPPGIPVATVAIDGADNAAILATQILAVSDDVLEKKITAMKLNMAENVMQKDSKLQERLNNNQN
ncbi:MAG: 5-(carboxyamino)imidazole ribonucleotide mutase [Treponema sp.]|nr:5-(carboxyamino)imidazole ribonucleotide mutase [Treponema sp.]